MFRNKRVVEADQKACSSSRREFYRKALISFMMLIGLGAVVGTVVSLMIH